MLGRSGEGNSVGEGLTEEPVREGPTRRGYGERFSGGGPLGKMLKERDDGRGVVKREKGGGEEGGV